MKKTKPNKSAALSKTNKLQLKRELIVNLSNIQLQHVIGGDSMPPHCSSGDPACDTE
jgi:hypothetical protein